MYSVPETLVLWMLSKPYSRADALAAMSGACYLSDRRWEHEDLGGYSVCPGFREPNLN